MYIGRLTYERYHRTLATYLRLAHSIPYCRSLRCGAVQVPVRHVHSLDRIQRNAAAKPRWLQRATCFVADVDGCLCAAVHRIIPCARWVCHAAGPDVDPRGDGAAVDLDFQSGNRHNAAGTQVRYRLVLSSLRAAPIAALTHFAAAPVHSLCLPRVTDCTVSCPLS